MTADVINLQQETLDGLEARRWNYHGGELRSDQSEFVSRTFKLVRPASSATFSHFAILTVSLIFILPCFLIFSPNPNPFSNVIKYFFTVLIPPLNHSLNITPFFML